MANNWLYCLAVIIQTCQSPQCCMLYRYIINLALPDCIRNIIFHHFAESDELSELWIVAEYCSFTKYSGIFDWLSSRTPGDRFKLAIQHVQWFRIVSSTRHFGRMANANRIFNTSLNLSTFTTVFPFVVVYTNSATSTADLIYITHCISCSQPRPFPILWRNMW